MEDLVIVQFLVALAMGLVGSFFDNERHDYEVPNKVWLVFGIGGFIVSGFRWGWSPIFLGIHLGFAALVSGGIYVAYLVSKGAIGGADVKASMALGVTLGLWSFVTILLSTLVLEAYTVVLAVINRTPLKEVLKMKAPFLPFLTVGIIGGFVVFAVTLI